MPAKKLTLFTRADAVRIVQIYSDLEHLVRQRHGLLAKCDVTIETGPYKNRSTFRPGDEMWDEVHDAVLRSNSRKIVFAKSELKKFGFDPEEEKNDK